MHQIPKIRSVSMYQSLYNLVTSIIANIVFAPSGYHTFRRLLNYFNEIQVKFVERPQEKFTVVTVSLTGKNKRECEKTTNEDKTLLR